MVVLRDGKSYDTANATTPERPLRRATRRSNRLSQASELSTDGPVYSESEPSTPQSVAKKRVRQDLAVQLTPIGDEPEDDTNKDDQFLRAAAETELPSPGLTPSPVHKKVRATTPPQPKAAKQPRVNNGIIPAAVVLLLAVAGAALWPRYGGAATQAVQQGLQASSNYVQGLQLQQQLTGAQAAMSAAATSAIALLQSHAASAQQQLQTVLLQLHVKYPTLVTEEVVTKLREFGIPTAADPGAWAPEVLAGILPAGQQWQDVATDISDALRTPASARNHKASAFILACASTDDCAEAAAAVSVLPPKGDACSLMVNATKIAAVNDKPAAALQAVVAPFLRRCPAGLVVLQHAEQMPVAAAPALTNALSELGGFQHDGKVDGSNAAYALLVQLPPQDVAAAAEVKDTATADHDIKNAFFGLQQQLLSQQQQGTQNTEAVEAVGRALKALHRRIEFAAPVKLGTAAEKALDLAVQAATAAAQKAAAEKAAAKEAARAQAAAAAAAAAQAKAAAAAAQAKAAAAAAQAKAAAAAAAAQSQGEAVGAA